MVAATDLSEQRASAVKIQKELQTIRVRSLEGYLGGKGKQKIGRLTVMSFSAANLR